MYFKTTIPKDHDTTREFLMKTFLMHEKDLRNEPLEVKEISLHCKYDLNSDSDRYKFWNEDVDIYFVGGKIPDQLQKWLEDYEFSSVDALPANFKHMLGTYNMTVKGLDTFVP